MKIDLNNITEFASYLLAYKFTPIEERPWYSENKKKLSIKKALEFELFVTTNPSIKKIHHILDPITIGGPNEEFESAEAKWTTSEKKYFEYVKEWEHTTEILLHHIKTDQALRFIQLQSNIDNDIQSVTQCQDFLDFNHYVHKRKDLENCTDEELGCLAVLLTEFQKSIERVLSNRNAISNTNFVAIDFEHATPNKASVCSVGIAAVENGNITDTYTSLIQPPNNEYFQANSLVHGIYETDTVKSPTFLQVWPEIKCRIDGKIIIAHGANHTDRHCLNQAMEINNIYDDLNIYWIDTQKICNAKLDVISKVCNIELDHHNALSDAIACAKVYLLYLSGNLPIEKILNNKGKKEQNNIATLKADHIPISSELLFPEFDSVINKDTPFYKKKVVVSGLYDRWPDRNDLAAQLKKLGADLDTSVGKYTNILCAGRGCGPSKLKKMQELIDAGKDCKVLDEQEIIILLTKCGELIVNYRNNET